MIDREVIEHGSKTIGGCNHVLVKRHAVASATDTADVLAEEDATVYAEHGSNITARGHSKVYAHHESHVTAYQSAIVFADGSATVTAYENSLVFASQRASVVAHDNAVVIVVSGTPSVGISDESTKLVIMDGDPMVRMFWLHRAVHLGKERDTVWSDKERR